MFKAHKSNVHKCPDCPQELATALGVELHRHRVHGMPKPSKLRETVTMQHFKTENKDPIIPAIIAKIRYIVPISL